MESCPPTPKFWLNERKMALAEELRLSEPQAQSRLLLIGSGAANAERRLDSQFFAECRVLLYRRRCQNYFST